MMTIRSVSHLISWVLWMMLAAVATEVSQCAANKALSKEARDSVMQTLNKRDRSGGSSLLIFDREGKVENAVPLKTRDLTKFDSLEDYLKSTPMTPTPASECENPKPIKPPPQCAICKDGMVICTNAVFGADKLINAPKPEGR